MLYLDIFKISKRINRTTTKRPKTGSSHNDKIKEVLKFLVSEVREIRKENKEYIDQITEFQSEVVRLKAELKKERERTTKIENKLNF